MTVTLKGDQGGGTDVLRSGLRTRYSLILLRVIATQNSGYEALANTGGGERT
jgi:hypothetical protein